ncbi:MAG: hypothetical protein EVJ46_00080 [Candidatus Acididesulfobacter guangdongensis]|uniref:Uncharacterized protein n=1 Tax=Acididesulfobacter guangdongensis TaxID=2597225 RepID=A0A519BHD7_ACIG2|nr:MAG: hypothetical protein EVJ46_00080 [Candidatus Acididesulfobacter guangdongensis]
MNFEDYILDIYNKEILSHIECETLKKIYQNQNKDLIAVKRFLKNNFSDITSSRLINEIEIYEFKGV